MTGSSSSEAVKQLLAAFQGGLREHGYVEGETIQLDVRHAEGRPGEWDDFAAEFVGIPVDIIVAPATLAAQQAASRATKTIPVVMSFSQDPVASGLVASLARPGGNVTGILNALEAQSAKRLELLRELAPGMKRVGAISDGVTAGGRESLKGAQTAARELNLEVFDLAVMSGSELPQTLQTATARGVDALLVGAVPSFITDRRHEITAYALERRIPLAGGADTAQWAESGGLVAFGADQLETIRRFAYFIDRILKGDKAGDLPIEHPSRFETIVNLKTAKALGLTVPQSVIGRATKVIQ
jgi:putative ABC transport system substrate-binding protein